MVLNTDQCQEPIISKQCLSQQHILLDDSGTVSPNPLRPPFPLSLFSQPGPASLSSKYKSFLLSFTCYLKARNSPAAEKARARAEFPRASALSTLLSLA